MTDDASAQHPRAPRRDAPVPLEGELSADLVVVGGGIVGLATAWQVLRRRPGTVVHLIEKEQVLAAHQTGHNSGVIHSGIYYRPDSDKLRTCRLGRVALIEFCQEHGIAHEICGKIVIATDEVELERLDRLEERAVANGIETARLDPAAIAEHEPHARGLAGLHVPDAGIVDYRAVCDHLARLIVEAGGRISLGHRVTGVRPHGDDGAVVTTDDARITATRAVTCGGLHSDRLADGTTDDGWRGDPGGGERIVPFRGEYFTLRGDSARLVNGLIYPVPDPDFPFLGVHLTRMIDGSIHAGPNAVPALAREGYRWRDVDLRDTWDVVGYPGTWRLARRYWRTGLGEIGRSMSKRAFTRALQRLVPDVAAADLVRSPAGVRAQALAPHGALLDDFVWRDAGPIVNVVNAPSPAATASLAIGHEIADRCLDRT